MGERIVWKGPGVRATEAEIAAIRSRANRHRASTAEGWARLRDTWERGALRPCTITLALNLASLYGPEVDVACGGQEPMADLWEAGTLYPTFAQLERLVSLTQQPPAFFTREYPHIDGVFLCGHRGGGYVPTPEPVCTFTRAAIEERVEVTR